VEAGAEVEEAAAAVAAAEVEAAGEEAEVEQDEQEWTPLPSGPWSAWPMRKNRQPKNGDIRVFAVAVSLSTLWAGGAVKFVDLPGGPADGVVCSIPPCTSRAETTKDIIFPLRLNKEAAPEETFTIHTVFYKLPASCAPPPPPPSRPQRDRKRKARYGDNGELDGNGMIFRTTQAARKASVDPSVEMGIPDYAAPGEEVWAMGLHAGSRKRFKAEVVSHRAQFPRIVVKYISAEDNNTTPIALPEMRTAYLTMADIAPKDW